MRSIFFMLSACSAVAQATDCQVADETTMLQGLRMESGSVARQQKRMKTTDAKGLDAKHLLKSLQNVAHNLDTMSTEEVDLALAEAADALATLSPAIQEQVEILQNAVLHAAAAVESCHVQEGVEQRASLWDAAEQQAGEVATCEAELATAVADEAQICSAASVADVQSECACNEATARREDKEELCAALTTAYEFAYCEYNLQCTTFHDCHGTETAVFNQVVNDVQDDMVPIEEEYKAAEQSTCIMTLIQEGMAAGAIDFVAIAACEDVDTSSLLIVYPDLPATPEACHAATAGSPSCGVNLLVDGCATAGTAHTTEAASSGATGSVRCCSIDGSSCDSDHLEGGCQSEKTFSQAQEICEANGERLCTEEEIDGGICCGSGCNFDSHQIWVTPVPHRVTVDGCTTAGSSPVRASAADDSGVTASVRCCSADGSSCVTQDLDGGCQTGKSFLDARELCEANDLRLCTESEISDGVCCGTGCNYDSHSIWVSN